MKKSFLILILLVLNMPSGILRAQRADDTVIIKNGMTIVGEILWMKSNRLEMDVDYGHDNWQIKWSRVTGINTVNSFQVSFSNGQIYYGSLKTRPDTGIVIITEHGDSIKCSLKDIVMLRPFEDTFLKKLNASISLGFDMTRARNLKSYSTRSKIGYTTRQWILGLTFDGLRSSQDEVEDIERSEVALNLYYLLPKRFFGMASTSSLSNTEQRLDLRWNLQAGTGNFLVYNQALYLAILAGANHNLERFSNETEDRDSWEGVAGLGLDIFNLGDLKLKTQSLVYLGITEKGRWRTDFKFDIKYDIKYFKVTGLTNKVFINLGFSANYDNRPAEDASKTDYVLTTALGLSWNE